jgi:HSP20 family protein
MKKQKVIRIMLAVGLVLGAWMTSSKAFADDTSQLKDQVQALQNRVNQLESQLANKQQDTSAAPLATAPVPPIPFYDQWQDPFAQMIMMRNQMDRNMQAIADTGMFSPRMDMKQTDKEYIITMDIPGMDKDKINIENKNGMLTISGERQSETDDNKNNQYYSQERSFGSFMQSIPLPEDAKTDQIDARYKNGVLTVTVARERKEDKKSESERITIK